jgi:small subunit ribosomal protein S16
MATRIRLRRMGANKRPFYRVVVADQRSPRDGRFIENIGKYHPLEEPSVIEIDQERALYWLRVGAQPSNQVRNLMRKVGIWDTFVQERPSATKGVKPPKTGRPEREKLSKKAQERAKQADEASSAAPVQEATVKEPAVEQAPVAEVTGEDLASAEETTPEEAPTEKSAEE